MREGDLNRPPSAEPDVLTRTIELGWSTFSSAWGLLVLGGLAMIAASMPGIFVSLVSQAVRGAIAVSGGSGSAATAVWVAEYAITAVLTILVVWPIQAGAGIAAVRASRGGVTDFGSMFLAFRRLKSVAGAMFLYTLVALLANAPGLAAIGWGFWPTYQAKSLVVGATEIALIAVGLVWTTVVGIWIAARLVVAPLRAADPDLPPVGAVAALAEAWSATRGHALAGVAMMILASIAMIVGLLCCGIGVVLLGIPLWLALQAGYYRAVFAHREPPAPPEPRAWTGSTPPQQPFI